MVVAYIWYSTGVEMVWEMKGIPTLSVPFRIPNSSIHLVDLAFHKLLVFNSVEDRSRKSSTASLSWVNNLSLTLLIQNLNLFDEWPNVCELFIRISDQDLIPCELIRVTILISLVCSFVKSSSCVCRLLRDYKWETISKSSKTTNLIDLQFVHVVKSYNWGLSLHEIPHVRQ